MRFSYATIAFLVAASLAKATAPYPFWSGGTGSSSCVGQAETFYSVISSYITTLPSKSSLNRFDVLTPVIQSTSAFLPLSTGSFTTNYIATESTYADQARTGQMLQQVYNSTSSYVYTSISKNPAAFLATVSMTSTACSDTRVSGLISLGNGFFKNASVGVSCSITLNNYAQLCADTAKSLPTLINEATVNQGSPGAIKYSCQDYDNSGNATTDTIGFKASVISNLSSATVAALCSFYQN